MRTQGWEASSGPGIWILAIALTLLAAWPRFHNLGGPGFYGDEETTAIASRSLAEQGEARMASGMPYSRSWPHTFLNAVSVRLFGSDSELAYRVPAALLGTLTVPLLFFLARRWVGFGAALLAALLLAVSEWHIATSREARMYAPFLLFYTAGLLTVWRWATVPRRENMPGIAALALMLMAMAFHLVGAIGLLLGLVPLAFQRWTPKPALWQFAFAAGTGALAWTYDRLVSAPQSLWNETYARSTAVTKHLSHSIGNETSSAGTVEWSDLLVMAGAGCGALLGLLIAHRAAVEDREPAAWVRVFVRYALAAMAGAFTATGRLHGAALSWLLFLLVYPHGLPALLRAARQAWIALAALAAVSAGIVCATLGLRAGVKALVIFPFPYGVWFFVMLGGVFTLFAVASLYVAIRPLDERTRTWRAFALAVLIPLLGTGLVSKWGGMRYMIEIYPFVLLLAAGALVAGITWIGQRAASLSGRSAVAIGAAVVLSGVLGGHGIPQAVRAATVMPGDAVDELVYDIPLYPDHREPGRFVAARLRPDDLVVAVDVIEQVWYVGRVDVGLRDPEFFRPFHYRSPDGAMRDIYANSRVGEMNDIEQLRKERTRRIWLITSGESHQLRDRELSVVQRRWLESIERTDTPVFVGRDGLSRVYCLNCDQGARAPG